MASTSTKQSKSVPLNDEDSKTLSTLRQTWKDWPNFETIKSTLTQAKELAEKNPENFETHLLLAELYDSTRKYDLCTQAAVKAVELNPDSPLAHIRLGQCLLRTATTGAEVSALDEFQIAVNLDQNNALAHAYIGFWYIFIQKFPEAKEELDKAEKLDAQSPEILTFLGTYYESVGDDKKAEEYYRQAIPLSRSYLTARLSLMLLMEKVARFDDVSDLCKQILLDFPDDPIALVKMAVSVGTKGNVEEAIKLLKRATEIEPLFAPAYGELGYCFYILKDYAEANFQFEHSLNLDMHNPAVHVNYGINLEAQGKVMEALEHYAESTRIEPTYALGYFNMAFALQNLGSFEEALENFRLASKHNPKSFDIRANYGLLLLRLERYEEALEQLQVAETLNPSDPKVHNVLGILYKRQNVLDKAKEHFLKAIELDPKFAEPHCNLGMLYEVEQKPYQALISYKRAIEVDPNSPEIATFYNNLGALLTNMQKLEESMTWYHKALEKNPNDELALRNVGLVNYKLGKIDEAIEYYKKAIEVAPDYATAHENLASALEDLGLLEEALVEFELALSLQPDSVTYQQDVARVKQSMNYKLIRQIGLVSGLAVVTGVVVFFTVRAFRNK